jgi:acid phosphatase (class A)
MNRTSSIFIVVLVLILAISSFGAGFLVNDVVDKNFDTAENDTADKSTFEQKTDLTSNFDINNLPDYSSVQLPDAQKILLRPPANGTDETSLDLMIAKRMSSPDIYQHSRWALAAHDNMIPACLYNCVIGVNVTEKETPILYHLVTKVAPYAATAISNTKNTYLRQRPFIVGRNNKFAEFSDKTCTPSSESVLQNDGSYPSGHSDIQYSQALILALVDPVDATAILKRGREASESRVVCNVHWYSDIMAGRDVAAMGVNALSSNSTFQQEIEAAKLELKLQKEEYASNGFEASKDWTVSGDDEATRFANEKLLNWNCQREQEVLDNFKLLP